MKKILLGIFTLFLTLATLSGCGKKEVKDIPILLYHAVVEEMPEENQEMFVTAEKFEEDLQYMKENGYTTISLEDMEKYYSGAEIELPEKPIMITFDDGYLNNYEVAYPLLKKYDSKATIYLIGWSVGRDTMLDSDKRINPHFTYEQGIEMMESGLVDFGSHTDDLHNLEGLSYGYKTQAGLGLLKYEGESDEKYRDRITGDLKKSKKDLEENLGVEISSIAYPYGMYNDIVIEVIKALDFKSGLVIDSDKTSNSIYEIRRTSMKEDINLLDIL